MNKALHLLHILFYCLCVLSVLWNKGNPYFTLSVIIALMIAGIISILIKRDGDSRKNLLIFLLLAASGIWLFYRLFNRVSSEMLIIETLSLAGICFFLSNKTRDAAFRLIISAVFLIYGCAATPPSFVFFAVPALILIFPIFYLSRLNILSNRPEEMVTQKQNYCHFKYIFFHVLIFIIAMGYMFYMLSRFGKDRKALSTSGGKSSYVQKIEESIANIEITEPGSGGISEAEKEIGVVQDFSSPETEKGLEGNLKAVSVNSRVLWSAFSEQVKGGQGIFAGSAILIVILVYFSFPAMKKVFSGIALKNKCRKKYLRAKLHIEDNPALCLKFCYLSLRDFLDLAGYPRKNNMELFDYGDSLKKIDPKLSGNAIAVFSLYSKMVYSRKSVNPDDSKEAFERLTALRDFLLINQKKAL